MEDSGRDDIEYEATPKLPWDKEQRTPILTLAFQPCAFWLYLSLARPNSSSCCLSNSSSVKPLCSIFVCFFSRDCIRGEVSVLPRRGRALQEQPFDVPCVPGLPPVFVQYIPQSQGLLEP